MRSKEQKKLQSQMNSLIRGINKFNKSINLSRYQAKQIFSEYYTDTMFITAGDKQYGEPTKTLYVILRLYDLQDKMFKDYPLELTKTSLYKTKTKLNDIMKDFVENNIHSDSIKNTYVLPMNHKNNRNDFNFYELKRY